MSRYSARSTTPIPLIVMLAANSASTSAMVSPASSSAPLALSAMIWNSVLSGANRVGCSYTPAMATEPDSVMPHPRRRRTISASATRLLDDAAPPGAGQLDHPAVGHRSGELLGGGTCLGRLVLADDDDHRCGDRADPSALVPVRRAPRGRRPSPAGRSSSTRRTPAGTPRVACPARSRWCRTAGGPGRRSPGAAGRARAGSGASVPTRRTARPPWAATATSRRAPARPPRPSRHRRAPPTSRPADRRAPWAWAAIASIAPEAVEPAGAAVAGQVEGDRAVPRRPVRRARR